LTTERLCEHLISYIPGATPFEVAHEISYYDGTVEAVVRCAACGRLALLQMIDWSPRHDVRVHALSAVAVHDLEEYLEQQLAPPYPDPFTEPGRWQAAADRYQEILDRLCSRAGPPQQLLACSAFSAQRLAAVPFPAVSVSLLGDWILRIPAEEESLWFEQLGLDKWAAA
jgi:hypothetical protein